MTKQKLTERRSRVSAMNAVLAELYPSPVPALNYSNTWELLVAVILSAQCTDARVNAVTQHLFKRLTTVEEYARISMYQLKNQIRSCGLYTTKAQHIKETARMIVREYGGEVPGSMEELLTLPGVARKTANIVLSNAFGRNEGVAVDTHVRRFAIRFDLTDYTDPLRIERDLMDIMPKEEWQGFNHRLVMYGREVCPARKHDCAAHPLTRMYPKAAKIWPKAR